MERANNYKILADEAANKGMINEVAFMMHQSVEHYYRSFILVQTNSSPSTHNIKSLCSLAEQQDPQLIDIWPGETKSDRKFFELLKRAYVETRYSESPQNNWFVRQPSHKTRNEIHVQYKAVPQLSAL